MYSTPTKVQSIFNMPSNAIEECIMSFNDYAESVNTVCNNSIHFSRCVKSLEDRCFHSSTSNTADLMNAFEELYRKISKISESIKFRVFDQFDRTSAQIQNQSQTSDLATKCFLEQKSLKQLKRCMLLLHNQFLKANNELLYGHLAASESIFPCDLEMPSKHCMQLDDPEQLQIIGYNGVNLQKIPDADAKSFYLKNSAPILIFPTIGISEAINFVPTLPSSMSFPFQPNHTWSRKPEEQFFNPPNLNYAFGATQSQQTMKTMNPMK